MAATMKPILLKGGVKSLGNIVHAIGDSCKEVNMQIEQMAFLQCKSSNDYLYTTIQQLGNILRREESQLVIKAYKSTRTLLQCNILH